MKQHEDNQTLELPLKRGRPSTGQALTPAQRKRAQRERDRNASRYDDYGSCTTERLLFDLGHAVTNGLANLAQQITAELQYRAETAYAAKLDAARQAREAVTVTQNTEPKQPVTVTEKPKHQKTVTVTKNKPAPKYRNKLTGETWTGRGRMPQWVMAWIAKGGTLDQLIL